MTKRVQKIILFGFQSIKLPDGYKKNPQFEKKGKLLYESDCVHNVKELKDESESVIEALVERQTKKHLSPYEVKLYVSIFYYLHAIIQKIINK